MSDSRGLPLAALVSGAQAPDGPYLHPVLEQVRIPGLRGRPRTRPEKVVADKAYDARDIRVKLRQRGIQTVIPERKLAAGKQRRKKGPHYRFEKEVYQQRSGVEQSIGWMKECRRVATRYEKLAVSFLAMIHLAFIRFCLKRYLSNTA